MKHVRIAFSISRAYHLAVKKEKCQFGQTQIKYLGHIICQEGVKVDPDKIQAMMKWPKPTTIKALRGFLGLTGSYRKFIVGYGRVPAPLTDMLQKNAFSWSPKAEEAFKLLKQAMMQASVLALPNFQLLFVVECDASGKRLGAVLMQKQRLIFYFSIALKGKNLFLSTYEKELMALVLAVKKWRLYLLGRHFVVRTDLMTEP